MVAAQVAELCLEERFCGPPASANGGYACGAIAELLGDEVEVTLRRPPPLGAAAARVGAAAPVHDGDELVAEARPATVPRRARTASRRGPVAADATRCSRVLPSRPVTCGPDRAAARLRASPALPS